MYVPPHNIIRGGGGGRGTTPPRASRHEPAATATAATPLRPHPHRRQGVKEGGPLRRPAAAEQPRGGTTQTTAVARPPTTCIPRSLSPSTPSSPSMLPPEGTLPPLECPTPARLPSSSHPRSHNHPSPDGRKEGRVRGGRRHKEVDHRRKKRSHSPRGRQRSDFWHTTQRRLLKEDAGGGGEASMDGHRPKNGGPPPTPPPQWGPPPTGPRVGQGHKDNPGGGHRCYSHQFPAVSSEASWASRRRRGKGGRPPRSQGRFRHQLKRGGRRVHRTRFVRLFGHRRGMNVEQRA